VRAVLLETAAGLRGIRDRAIMLLGWPRRPTALEERSSGRRPGELR
jgi:hypothetical protein